MRDKIQNIRDKAASPKSKNSRKKGKSPLNKKNLKSNSVNFSHKNQESEAMLKEKDVMNNFNDFFNQESIMQSNDDSDDDKMQRIGDLIFNTSKIIEFK